LEDVEKAYLQMVNRVVPGCWAKKEFFKKTSLKRWLRMRGKGWNKGNLNPFWEG